MISELFIKTVKAGAFSEAQAQMAGFEVQKISDTLFLLAYDDSDICSYVFLLYLLLKDDTIALHKEAWLITSMGINYLPGAYEAAAYHARSVYEMTRKTDPANDGGILFLCVSPDRPFRAEEVVPIAKEILTYEPENEWALRVINESSSWIEDPLEPICNERDQLRQFIASGKFPQAKQLLNKISKRELNEIIYYLGCEDKNLCAYAFTWYLMRDAQSKELAELHYLAYRIVTLAYPVALTGCDAAGLFHLRQAMTLDPDNEKYVNHFLRLHTPAMGPTMLISDDEAVAVATRALEKNDCNGVAMKTLKKLGKLDPKYEKDDGLRIPAK